MIGYANSMFLATHGILARSASGGAVDPDAQAFITAASITDPTQQSAINQLVVDLKGYGVWTKMKALYPFCGSTASQHKWNLKDPRDLDAAFRLVFNGGWTHSVNGALPNGTNAFANTYFNPIAQSSALQSFSLSFYSRTNSNAGNAFDIGSATVWGSGYQATTIATKYNNNNTFIGIASSYTQNAENDSRGFYLAGTNGSTTRILYKNGVNTFSGTSAQDGFANQRLYIGAINDNGLDNARSNKQTAFASIGEGLTPTQAANFYTAVQAFQTTLGRSIGTQTVSDADAQAFVTNAGIVDQVEANAINNLVIGLKADSLWTKMKAVYPMVGGTSTTNSYNLKNTAQYQITWVGGVTHANTGVTFNGTNGYANTNFAPNSALTANSNHVALYSRTAAARSQTFAMDFGQGTDLNISNGIWGCMRRSSNNAVYGATNASAQGSVTAANTNGSGMFVNSITSATSRKIYKNAVTLGTLTTNISQTLSAPNMFIGADNNNGSPNLYSDYQASFFSIGDGLDDTETANLNTRVTTFQTALNRNV